jgi:hypothetical protein
MMWAFTLFVNCIGTTLLVTILKIGEIGLAGIAAAITDAIHHATGVRVRELPVKIEDLLA